MKVCYVVVTVAILTLVCQTSYSFDCCVSSSTAVNIIVVLQENAPELIKVAMATLNMINNDTNIVSGKTISLLTSSTVFDYIQEDIVAFVGLFQLSDILFFYPLSASSQLSSPFLVSGASDPRVFNYEKYPNLFHLVHPTTEIIKQALQFFEAHEWKQLSVITDAFDYQNYDTARQLHYLSREYSSLEIRFYSVSLHEDVEYVVQDLKPRVSLVAVSALNAFKLLCKAYSNEMTWPRFAWVVLYIDSEDLFAFSSNSMECDHKAIVEGVIFARQLLAPEDTSTVLVSGLTYEELVTDVYKSTLYLSLKNVLHDALWASALAFNACSGTDESTDILSRISFSGATGQVEFSSSNNRRTTSKTMMYQITNGSKLILKNGSVTASHFNSVDLNLLPAESLSSAPGLFMLFIICLFLCFLFVSVVLALYCHFRHEDSIKSTSFSLSLMIFVGCYLILLYQVVTNMSFLPQYESTYSDGYKVFRCFVRIWLHALGIPSILIFATLLVKTARIYYIFLSPQTLKFSSNTALLVYIVVLMIPNAILLVVWTMDTAMQGEGLLKCTGAQNLFLYLFLMAAYFIVILLALVVLAVLTRKIKYRNFKDTKKVNGLVFMLIYTYTFTLFYWMFVWQLYRSETHISRIVLNVGHILIVSECVGMLFIPKVYSFVKEVVIRSCQNNCKQRTSNLS